MFRLRIPAIKAPKLPKLTSLSIHKIGNGHMVTHRFAGAKAKQFSFDDPTKMLRHLRGTLKGEWLHPNVDTEATRIEGELNI